MYADKITGSMQKTIDETERRRAIQQAYNQKHGITPTQIVKSKETILSSTKVADADKNYEEKEEFTYIAAEPQLLYNSQEELEKLIATTEKKMKNAAKELDFMEAARLRDILFTLKSKVEK
jgi:excinuclease ABC subunit B